MRKKVLKPGLILLVIVMFLPSCSKYDEGPVLSLYSREKRVQGRWYFSSVKYNEVDSTDSYRVDPLQYIEFYINPEKGAIWNAYTWSVNASGYGAQNLGMWKFNDEQDSITMVTTITIYTGNNVREDTTVYNWKINRLAYTEFWTERQEDDTTQVKWKLWKIAY